MLSFLAAGFEIFGVSIFIPIFQYVRTAGDIESLVSEFPLWAELIRIFDFLGLNLSLTVLLLTAFSLFLIRQLFLFLRLIITATIQTKIVKDWRDKLFLKYFSTKIELQDKMPIGQLIASLTTELPRAAVAVFAPVELAVHAIVLGVYLAFLAVISWQMTLAGLLLMGIAGWLPKYWSGLGRITGVSLTEANLTMSDFLLTRLLSPRLLRISQTLPQEFQKFQSITASQRKFFFRGALLRSKVEISIEPFVIAISLGFIFFSKTILDFSIEIIGIYLVVIIRLLPVIKKGVESWCHLQ
ncbi:MAG: ABC transporter transmembrane domain-containing protein, partial [Gammaproteobacteria bacterium]